MINELVDATTLMNVKSIEDNSDSSMARVLVTFSNGLRVSVIKGSGSYGAFQACLR